MPKCLYCGKEFKIQLRSNEKYCSADCRKLYHRYKDKPPKYCAVCGKEFKGRSYYYCSDECRQKVIEQRQKNRNRNEHKKVEVKPKKRKKLKYTIEQVQKLARAEGLSYGQFVAKYGL